LDKCNGWKKEKDRDIRFPDPFYIPDLQAVGCMLSATDALRQSHSPTTSRFFFFISTFFSWKDCFMVFSLSAAASTAGSDVPGCAC
jgi:hypothetical protein